MCVFVFYNFVNHHVVLLVVSIPHEEMRSGLLKWDHFTSLDLMVSINLSQRLDWLFRVPSAPRFLAKAHLFLSSVKQRKFAKNTPKAKRGYELDNSCGVDGDEND